MSFFNYGRILIGRNLMLEQLEERIVLDAAVEASTQENGDQDQPEASQETTGDQALPAEASDAPESQAEQPPAPLEEIFSQDLNVVLISNALDKVEDLSEAAVDGAEVIVYDAEQDDLPAITGMLRDLTDATGKEIGQLAILSHGGAGVLPLSATEQISFLEAQSDPSAWHALGRLLAQDARIDLYGCDIGQGANGALLVSALSETTGAVVWASDDATGTRDQADWCLETHSGESDKGYLIDASLLADDDFLLAEPVINPADVPVVVVDEDQTSPTFTLTAHDADRVDPDWVYFVVDGVSIDNSAESTVTVTNGSLHSTGAVVHDGNGTYTQEFDFTPDPDYNGTLNLSYYFVSRSVELTDSGQSLGSGWTKSVVLGDLDGDGDIDMVEGNQGPFVDGHEGEANRVWFNDGHGSFYDSGQSLGVSATNALALGDLDGDLDLDLIEVNGNQLGDVNRVWFNDGHGFFTRTDNISGSMRTSSVALGDLDKDGDLDIVEGNGWEGPIQIRLNNGHGQFGDGDQLLGELYEETLTVALADVNRDGWLDILQGRSNDGILIWLNDGDPDHDGKVSFSDSGQSLGSTSTVAFAVGDLDGVHGPDFVAAKSQGPSEIWLNDGTGIFSKTAQAIGVEKTYSVDLADLDKDGDLDLIAGNYQLRNRVWLNNGSGTFTMSDADIGSGYAYSVATADLDADTYPDLVLGNHRDSPNKVYFGTHEESSGSKTLHITVNPVDDPAEILDSEIPHVVVDEDQTSGAFTLTAHDSDLPDPGDVNFTIDGNIIDNSAASTVTLANGSLNVQGPLVHDGDGTYTQQFTFTPDPNYYGEINESFSFDEPHESSGAKNLNITVNHVDSPSTLDDIPGLTDEQSMTTSAFTLTAQDEDGTDADTVNFVVDGHVIDNSGPSVVVVTGGTLNVLGAMIHDGNGRYSQAFSFTPDPTYSGALELDCRFITEQPAGTFYDSDQAIGDEKTWSVALGDLDGDGDVDLVVGNLRQANEIWFNDGSGFFIDSGQRLGPNGTHEVVLGDVDGDGDLDIAEANDMGPDVIWLNDGSGQFTQSLELDSGSNTFGIALGKLDTDDYMDLIQGRYDKYNNLYTAEACRVWINSGSGSFTDSGQDTAPILTRAVALGDFNGDHILDLVDVGGGKGWVWMNNGNGVFLAGDGTEYSFGDSRDVVAADVDGDLDQDLIIADFSDGARVWLNDGSGGFSDSGVDLDFPSCQTTAVAVGDVNGDKYLDIISGNSSGYDRVYLNDGTGDFTDSGQELGEKNAYTMSVALADLDGDGDLDLVQGNDGNPNQIFFNGTATSETKLLVITVTEPIDPETPVDPNANPTDHKTTPDYGAQGDDSFHSAVDPTPSIRTNLLGLVTELLPHESGSGESAWLKDRLIAHEVEIIAEYLHEALFGETQESQYRAWNSLLSHVSAKQAESGEEWLPLEAFFLKLKEWRVGKTLDEILLVFNADEIKLAEWFNSLLYSADNVPGDQQAAFLQPGESFHQSLWGKSQVFDMKETRVADLFSSHLASHGLVDSYEPHAMPSKPVCRIFDLGSTSFVDVFQSDCLTN